VPAVLKTAGFRRRLGQAELAQLTKLPTADAAAMYFYSEARSLLLDPDAAGHAARAIAALQRALEKDPQFVAAKTSLSDAFRLRYDETHDPLWLDRADACAQQALEIAATDPSAHVSLARVKQRRGETQEAIRQLRLAVDFQPDDDEAHRALGLLLAQEGAHEEASRELRYAVSLRPDFWNNHFTLGYGRFVAGHYDEAIASYQRVTELQPNYANGFVMLGAAYQRAGLIERATGSYEHAARIGQTAAAYTNLGFVYALNNRDADAVVAYRAAADKEPLTPVIWRNLGDAYSRLNRRRDATASYQTAVRLLEKQLSTNHRDVGAIAMLALCEAKLGHQSVAEHRAAEAFVLQPNDREVLYKRAAVYAIIGKREQALEALRSAIDSGYDRALARDDVDLAPLRSSAKFEALVGTATQRVTTVEDRQ